MHDCRQNMNGPKSEIAHGLYSLDRSSPCAHACVFDRGQHTIRGCIRTTAAPVVRFPFNAAPRLSAPSARLTEQITDYHRSQRSAWLTHDKKMMTTMS